MIEGLSSRDLEGLQSKIDSLSLLNLKIEMFRKGNFDFIVEGIADNSEGDWDVGQKAKHEKQKQALKILTDNEFNEFLYGGAAGGAKTWTGCCWLAFSALAYPDTNWFVARKELKDLLGSVMKTFYKVFREYGIEEYKFNAQKNFIEFPNGSVINLIEVKYKPADPMFEDLGSFEYTGGWIEEIGEIHEKAFSVLSTRIGRYNNSKFGLSRKLFLTCNPKRNWAKNKFYDKHMDGSLYEENKILLPNGRKRPQRIYLNCLVTENPFIEQEYIDSLYAKSTEDPTTYQRLLKGNWDYEDNPNQLCEQECIENVFSNYHIEDESKKKKTYITADIALEGSDLFVIFVWRGWKVIKVVTRKVAQSAEIVGDLRYLQNEYRVSGTRTMIDGDGIGSMLKGQVNARFFKNGGRVVKTPKYTSNYRNISVQCLYYLAREIINNDQMWIADENLTREYKKRIKDELAQIIRVPNKQDFAKLDIKAKGEMMSDLGFSPDFLDCMKMRVWFDLKKELDLTVVWN